DRGCDRGAHRARARTGRDRDASRRHGARRWIRSRADAGCARAHPRGVRGARATLRDDRGGAAAGTDRYPFQRWMPAPLYWPVRAVRTLAVAFSFAVFWATLVGAAWTLLPLVMLWPGTPLAKRRRAHTILRIGLTAFHLLMRVLRLYRRTSSVRVARPPGVA